MQLGKALLVYLPLFLTTMILLVLAFNLIQIPFSLIGKKAVYAVLIVQFYYLSLITATYCITASSAFNVSEPALIIIFILFLYYFLQGFYREKFLDLSLQNQTTRTVLSALIFAACIFTPICFYFKLFFFPRPVLWLVSLTDWLISIPIVGGILLTAARIASGLFLLGAVFVTLLTIFKGSLLLYRKLFNRFS